MGRAVSGGCERGAGGPTRGPRPQCVGRGCAVGAELRSSMRIKGRLGCGRSQSAVQHDTPHCILAAARGQLGLAQSGPTVPFSRCCPRRKGTCRCRDCPPREVALQRVGNNGTASPDTAGRAAAHVSPVIGAPHIHFLICMYTYAQQPASLFLWTLALGTASTPPACVSVAPRDFYTCDVM